MTVPDYQSLMLPLLKSIEDGKERRIADCIELVASNLNLSQEDKDELLPSGKVSVLYNRIHWAKSYMLKALLIESPSRGMIKITQRGTSLLGSSPSRIDNKSLRKFPEFAKWQENNTANKPEAEKAIEEIAADTNPEEVIEHSHATLQTQLRTEILENVLKMPPAFFERLIVDLLIAMGYGGGRSEMGKALGRSGDGGVDGVIKEDELGLDLIYVQAKRYDPDSTIGRPALQAFSGSLDGFNASKGVFVTTSSFASTAVEFVEKIHKRIILIDGRRLAELMTRHNVGVRVKNTYEVKKIDEDYFSEQI